MLLLKDRYQNGKQLKFIIDPFDFRTHFFPCKLWYKKDDACIGHDTIHTCHRHVMHIVIRVVKHFKVSQRHSMAAPEHTICKAAWPDRTVQTPTSKYLVLSNSKVKIIKLGNQVIQFSNTIIYILIFVSCLTKNKPVVTPDS